jgi:hypothetical protein
MRVSGSGTDETGADELRGVEAGRVSLPLTNVRRMRPKVVRAEKCPDVGRGESGPPYRRPEDAARELSRLTRGNQLGGAVQARPTLGER